MAMKKKKPCYSFLIPNEQNCCTSQIIVRGKLEGTCQTQDEGEFENKICDWIMQSFTLPWFWMGDMEERTLN